ncbi:DUF294 nucleotidyltransferase-like domain-containing protein [Paenibacillus turpanensis]|uniref:DUF294 nucleotidyltransferase-like domain-containing protein n=1 Tax=Paenibacillus turpanensis TaxID=2689078 RepID=UPI00140815B9|nr:DUF294 nucleotidyltransferase-like domain-containing protein [Paenibacillus turpanensis]
MPREGGLQAWTTEAQNASSIEELRTIREKLIQTRPLPPAGQIVKWSKQINGFYDQLIRRTIKLTEQTMLDSGMGPPPASYAFLLFGSGGRSEQTLYSDQDNGLIYEDDANPQTKEYFQYFAEQIKNNLELLGFPPCDGNVICTNPMWNQPFTDWVKMLSIWFSEPSWEHVRYLLITADLRFLYGNEELSTRLQKGYRELINQHPEIIGTMLKNTLHHKITLGLFGQLIRERYGVEAGGFDIKYGAYIPLVNGIRLLALREKIEASSTLERIESLQQCEELSAYGLDWTTAFEDVLELRLQTPYEVKEGVYHAQAALKKEQLNPEVLVKLKRALHTGKRLQRLVKKLVHEPGKG